ncbi:unnamed protein product [Nezara viridula]|uniref:Uncharacterized protein n=1 Tax=Nezara viridula TaxID=85310 RepID=A0A9P0HDN0_NEZVI|nr:unnamed protein product [Nezara viridula]
MYCFMKTPSGVTPPGLTRCQLPWRLLQPPYSKFCMQALGRQTAAEYGTGGPFPKTYAACEILMKTEASDFGEKRHPGPVFI